MPDDNIGPGVDQQAERAGMTPAELTAEAEKRSAEDGQGLSHGEPALAQLEGHSFQPSGGPAVQHWQKGVVSEPGIDDRGNVFFAAVEMTRMPMVVTDPNQADNPIVFANGAFLDLTGYTQEEVYGNNCRFLQGPLTDRSTVKQLADAIAGRKPVAVEVLNYRKDGSSFWNALFIGPIFDKGGQLLYFFASQLDVTRRRNSEDAFRQAQKMEAVGQLTAGLAHDFNNAIHVILGNLKRVDAKAGDEAEVRKGAERATRAAEHAAKLTKQLLAFARKTRLEPRDVDLNAVVSDFGEMLSRTLGTGIDVRYELDPTIPPCVIDPVHTEMALLNVLTNARDAMAGGGRVTVRTSLMVLGDADARVEASGVAPGNYVALVVEDEGPGMSQEVLARSTEPFFTTKQGKGTGLGLAMVHGFVRQSGGRLDITSEQGEGTVVRMLFPASSEHTARPTASRTEPVMDPNGGSEVILAVDDDEGVLSLAVHSLTDQGYSVLSARSGEEAIEILKRTAGRVDLLFTDIVMPGGINGLVLATEARRIQPDISVLLSTGYNEDLVAGASAAGGAGVLGKPYNPSDLTARVRAVLDGGVKADTQNVPHEG